MEQLAAYDRYPWEYNTFILGGDVILIEKRSAGRCAERLASGQPGYPSDVLVSWKWRTVRSRSV